MPIYGSRGVQGQTVEIIARRVLSGELPEVGTLDLTALQQELGADTARPSMSTAGDPRGAVEADLAFHRSLLGATQNELQERMEAVLGSALVARDQVVHGSDDHPDATVPSRRAVLDAAREQDPDAAEAAMSALLDKAISGEERVRPGTGLT
ncbi:FadR/GntR family transcriptional regulator [Streptacidiphilus sp. MAP5-3]|uniref:FadR/GntR family transcriptional regulator n=1 Tax=unclassified Streptacidiphilus TaxID=2643834 RepID=UPI003514D888